MAIDKIQKQITNYTENKCAYCANVFFTALNRESHILQQFRCMECWPEDTEYSVKIDLNRIAQCKLRGLFTSEILIAMAYEEN